MITLEELLEKGLLTADPVFTSVEKVAYKVSDLAKACGVSMTDAPRFFGDFDYSGYSDEPVLWFETPT